MKVASTVRRGAVGKGQPNCGKYLAGRLPYLYFSQLGKLLKAPDLPFTGRTRRPPRDPINSCLSFGYTLLGTIAETEVQRSGLDPMIGFFHQPHHNRPSLALDLVEEFRPFIDALVLRLVNRRQLGPLDFERRSGADLAEVLADMPSVPGERETGAQAAEGEGEDVAEAGVGEGVYLSATGRRVFLTEFFRRMRERLYYPPRQGTFELRDVLREQAYHLARVIEDREAAYEAFVPG